MRIVWQISAVCVGVACLGLLTPVAWASCVPPAVSAAPTRVAPGGTTHVSGTGWATGCNDVVTVVNGTPTPAMPAPPDHVSLYFVQAGARTFLASLTANAAHNLDAEVTIPVDAQSGPAAILAIGHRAGKASANVFVADSGARLPFTGSLLTAELLIGCTFLLLGLGFLTFRGQQRKTLHR